MKSLLPLLASLAVAFPALTEETPSLLHAQPLPLIAAPTFAEPLDASFSIAKGRWTPAAGILNVLDLPAEKHIPVLHHKVGLNRATIEVEFFIEGPGSFLVGCDADKHVGRVVVNAAGLSIAEDSVKPSHTLARLAMPVKPGEWHRLRVEWTGDQTAASLDGKELRARHAYLATPKSRSWLAAGKSVKVRHLKISGDPIAATP